MVGYLIKLTFAYYLLIDFKSQIFIILFRAKSYKMNIELKKKSYYKVVDMDNSKKSSGKLESSNRDGRHDSSRKDNMRSNRHNIGYGSSSSNASSSKAIKNKLNTKV